MFPFAKINSKRVRPPASPLTAASRSGWLGAMDRANPLKARLSAGRPALGCWLSWAYPVAAEVVALAGYDCVVIDHEHGFGGLAETVGCLQALSATATAALVRVPWNDPVYIKRVLDLGVDGIMVPSVGTAAEARAAVAACRYPPRGIRGAAYGQARASGYGMHKQRYRETADDALLIVCQIETVAGVDNLADIAAVDGVDSLFVGPYDLSGSLGKLGQFDDPAVQETIRRAERSIKQAGRWLGVLPSLGRNAAAMVRDGADLVVSGSDAGLLRNAAVAEISAFRADLGIASE